MGYGLGEWLSLLAWSALVGFGFTVGAAVASSLIGLLKGN
jgi:hypothetical protein